MTTVSSDESVAIIKRFCEQHAFALPILLDENKGGEAVNVALERCAGQLLHLTENDIEYLPGWSQVVVDLFESFPTLGQLSPFGPVPEDSEVWVPKPCVLRHAMGRILYEAYANVGTTCILRREIVERGVRVHNLLTGGTFLFPDDVRLSAEVKQAGFLVAFAPHYLVHNRGHSMEEFLQREPYYHENYRSKPVGVQGWRTRMQSWRERPRPMRASFLFPEMKSSGEKSEQTQECREPWLWSMFDGWTAEVETIEFLYALVKLLKPNSILETGSWRGITAAAIGRALRENGRGHLVTIELDPESFAITKERIRAMDLDSWVTAVRGSSLDYIPSVTFDFALFDSELTIREDELRHFLPAIRPGAMILFHDSNDAHRIVGEAVRRLEAEGVLDAMFLSTPRGLAICRLRDKSLEDYATKRERLDDVSQQETPLRPYVVPDRSNLVLKPGDDGRLQQALSQMPKRARRKVLSSLDGWLEYSSGRSELPPSFLQRISHIIRLLLRGYYHRYAHGFGSALRDLRKPGRLRSENGLAPLHEEPGVETSAPVPDEQAAFDFAAPANNKVRSADTMLARRNV